MGQQRRKYTDNYKAAAVERLYEPGATQGSVSEMDFRTILPSARTEIFLHLPRLRFSLADRPDGAFRFFDALTSEGEDPPNDLDGQIRSFGRVLEAAEVGCYRSHHAVLNAFVSERTSPWLLVLEDDVWLDPDFDITEVIAFAESRTVDYVRLFAKMYKPAKIIGMLSGFRQIVRFWSDPYGAQAYLINRAGAERFLSCVETIVMPIDDELGRFWRHGLFPVSVFPFPVVERAMQSSISTERDKGGKTRRSFLLPLIAFRFAEKLRKIKANWKGL